MFNEVNIVLLAIMAFILSPTDAALGQAVVNSKRVPLKVRETVNVESGLNDGLVLPPILIAIMVLQGENDQLEWTNLSVYVLKQLLFAPIVGIVLGWGGGRLISWSASHKLSDPLFQGISVVAISILAYLIAEHLGGNGYIASFVSGLCFQVKSKTVKEEGKEFGEFLSQPLAFFVFFAFGAILIPHYLSFVTWQVVLYAILSLTLFRMVPVILSLTRVHLPFSQKLFMAWFGPRGIASVLYLLMLSNTGLEVDNVVFATIVTTVLLSVYLHGLSAVPYSNWLGKQAKNEET
jgi:NhaP-type Na+/H+ or K+/H+ antiporter